MALTDELREEIPHWQFIDTCSQWLRWQHESHVSVRIITDSSGFAWGGVNPVGTMWDYWPDGDVRPVGQHLSQSNQGGTK